MNAKVRPEGEQRSAGQEAPRMNAPHGGALGVPRLSRRAESLGTENAFVVLAEVNALIREGAPWPPSTPAETDTAINASRIADVTGIPRETVRRKLALLEERGWIEQTASQSWKLVVSGQKSKVYGDLAALDARGIARAARFLAALRQLT